MNQPHCHPYACMRFKYSMCGSSDVHHQTWLIVNTHVLEIRPGNYKHSYFSAIFKTIEISKQFVL